MLLQLIFIRLPEDDVYKQILDIRKEIFYPSPYDERYWNGGIHFLFDEAWMKKIQQEDVNSHFALALDSNDRVKAYVRFSTKVNADELCGNDLVLPSSNNLAMIHIIAASKDIRGKELLWHITQESRRGKAGRVLYEEVFKFCSQQSCNAIVADVCVYPIPNIPSLMLHKNLGFMPLARDADKHIRIDESGNNHVVRFVRLVKASSKDWNLQRLPDQRLILSPSYES